MPYQIEPVGGGIYHIWVYDPNYPDTGGSCYQKYLTIDVNANTWEYDMSCNLGTDIWQGAAISQTIGLQYLAPYQWAPECPFCRSGSLHQAPEQEAEAQVWLDGVGHLQILDSQGRSLGYQGDQWLDEIPGAYAFSLVNGAEAHEPIYMLPLTETYALRLDGATLTQPGAAKVTQFGPGYASQISGIQLAPGAMDELWLANDGSQILYHAQNAEEVNLSLALGAEGGSSFKLTLNGVDLESDNWTNLSAELLNGRLSFDTSGTSGAYELQIGAVFEDGPHNFNYPGVTIQPGETHSVDYADWDGGEYLDLQVDWDSDGSVDEVITLDNRYYPRLLFDENHQEMNTLDWTRAEEIVDPRGGQPEWVYYGALKSDLANEFTLHGNPSTDLTPAYLADYAAVILAVPTEALSNDEVIALQAYVANGGGLLMLGDCGYDPPNPELMATYGISFDWHCLFAPIPDQEGDFTVLDFADHPAVNGLGATGWGTNWGQSLLAFGQAQVLATTAGLEAWEDSNANDAYDSGVDRTGAIPVIVARDTGCGRVVAVADNSFQDDAFEWRNAGNDDNFSGFHVERCNDM